LNGKIQHAISGFLIAIFKLYCCNKILCRI
jgi:hypothetical protein